MLGSIFCLQKSGLFRSVADTNIPFILTRFGPTRIYPNETRHGPTRRSGTTIRHDTVRLFVHQRNTTRIDTKLCLKNETRIDTNRCDMGLTRIDTIRINFHGLRDTNRHELWKHESTRNHRSVSMAPIRFDTTRLLQKQTRFDTKRMEELFPYTIRQETLN